MRQLTLPIRIRQYVKRNSIYFESLIFSHIIFILRTHEGSHWHGKGEVSLTSSIVVLCQGLFRPQVPCTPAYTALLLTLLQRTANKQGKGHR